MTQLEWKQAGEMLHRMSSLVTCCVVNRRSLPEWLQRGAQLAA